MSSWSGLLRTEGQHITVKSLPGTTSEQAHAARARGWLYIFGCWQENQKADKPAPEPVGRDDVKESNGYVATQHHNK